MTTFIVIVFIIFAVSLGCLLWILMPKLSTLASIDIEAIPQERNMQAKDRILYDRMRRRIKEWESFLAFALHPIADFFKQFFKAVSHAYKRLSDAREYQKKQWFKANTEAPTESLDSDQYQRTLKDAEKLLNDERYDDAESKCIELISRNKDGLSAYSMLIKGYCLQKEWEKARDVSEYLAKVYKSSLKKSSEESRAQLEYDAAQNLAILADIYSELSQIELAFQQIRKALALQPSNPKYLDACIEIAILAQQRLKAEKYLDQLRSANPENNKIGDFDERIRKLPY